LGYSLNDSALAHQGLWSPYALIKKKRLLGPFFIPTIQGSCLIIVNISSNSGISVGDEIRINIMRPFWPNHKFGPTPWDCSKNQLPEHGSLVNPPLENKLRKVKLE